MWKFYDSSGTNISNDMDLFKMWYIQIKNLDCKTITKYGKN